MSEVCAPEVDDIERSLDRMCLKIRQGKSRKDRSTFLSPRLLAALHTYWRDTRRASTPNATSTIVATYLRAAAVDRQRIGRLFGHGRLSTSRYIHLSP